MIIVARAIQGVGAACVMGVNIALTRLIYPREVLGRGLALNAMVIAIATASGPTIAGGILSIASWHWLFLINVPFGIAAFILGKKLLPHNPPKNDRPGYDWISSIENAIVFGLIFYALGSLAHKGDTTVSAFLLAAGIITGIFYVRRQFNRRNPMLPVDLFGIKLYSLSIITSVCSFIAQNVAMIALPFLFLNNLGFSEITTGLLMTPWPLATMMLPLIFHHNESGNRQITPTTAEYKSTIYLYVMNIMSLLLSEMHDPNVVAGKRQTCTEQGTEQPQNACKYAAKTSGMDRVNPSAKFISRHSISVHCRRSYFSRTTAECIAVGSPSVSCISDCHSRRFGSDSNLGSIGILSFKFIIDLLPAAELRATSTLTPRSVTTAAMTAFAMTVSTTVTVTAALIG